MSIHSFKVTEEDHHQRLDVYLTAKLEEASSRSFVKKIIDGGHVHINGKPTKAHYNIHEGDAVEVDIPDDALVPKNIPAENIPLDIFYEDQFLAVIHKPVGLLVHPAQGVYTGTLVNALIYHFKQLSDYNTAQRAGIVHRLDQDTSGLMVVAKDNSTHKNLADQFKKHKVKKKYVALVEGEIEFDEGKIDVPLGRDPRHRDKRSVNFDDASKDSETIYRVLKRHQGVSLVALYPKTGRMHQLRVHMKYIKHPILGDKKYGQQSTFKRLALHAQSIGFIHPHTKAFAEFSTRIPADFLKKVGIKN